MFAEKVEDMEARNSTVEALISKINDELAGHPAKEDAVCFPGADVIFHMYCGTAEDCPGRRVLVRAYSQYANASTLLPEANDVPGIFRRDLLFEKTRIHNYAQNNSKLPVMLSFKEKEGVEWKRP